MAEIPPVSPRGGKATPREPDDLLRHLQTPVDVQLNIRFHATGDPAVAGRSAARKDDPLASALPAEAMTRLRGLEDKVMPWLAASDGNRVLFLSDPIAALQQIDKTLDKTLVKQLQRARQRLAPDSTVDPRVRLSQIRVAVVGKTQPDIKPSKT
jgi:hypothetical protein